MKIWLRLVYADGDTLYSCDLASALAMELCFRLFILNLKFGIASTTTLALLLRFYCAFAVSVTIRVILTKLSNRSGIAIQWNGGLRSISILLGV